MATKLPVAVPCFRLNSVGLVAPAWPVRQQTQVSSARSLPGEHRPESESGHGSARPRPVIHEETVQGHGPRGVGRLAAGRGSGCRGSAPVIHPDARGGPECRARQGAGNREARPCPKVEEDPLETANPKSAAENPPFTLFVSPVALGLGRTLSVCDDGATSRTLAHSTGEPLNSNTCGLPVAETGCLVRPDPRGGSRWAPRFGVVVSCQSRLPSFELWVGIRH
jgi:hypothetical protein